MAKNLKTSVQLDTRKAVKNLDALEKKIRNVQRAINNQTAITNKLNTATNKLVKTNNKVVQSANKATSAHNKQGKAVNSLTTKVHRLANAYLGVLGAKVALTSSDTITKAENKLNNINANQIQARGGTAYDSGGGYTDAVLTKTQSDLNKMYTSAQKVRMGYADMMSNVSKSMTLAGGAFGDNTDNAIRFQEIMAEAYTLGGASAAEQSSSMYQMIQGLGSGILQGDELRSVREGAPLAYAAIEEFAQGIFGAEENLKDLASQGKITSDIVVAAIMDAGADMDAAFANTSMTFEQAWTNIKNTALAAFTPTLQLMNQMLNSGYGKAMIEGIGNAMVFLGNALRIAFTLMDAVFTWMYDNWYWLKYIALSVAVVIGLAISKLTSKIIFLGVQAVVSLLKPILIANWWILLIGAIIALVIHMAGSFENACGVIVGAFSWAGAFVHNVIAVIINFFAVMVTFMSVGAYNIYIALHNAFQGAIVSFWEWVSECLNGTGLVAKAVSKIASVFGLDGATIDTKINGAKGNMKEYEDMQKALLEASETMKYIDLGEAYKGGYELGVNGAQWLSDKVGGAKDWLSEKLNLTGLPNELINPTDVDTITNGVKGIDGNTGTMADAMELTAEDLEYLRKVADMEWKKEFTTANIQVDMSNYNTVNGDSDLDGIVTKLTDKLYEELHTVANGVYA